MVHVCCVPGCGSSTRKTKHLSFHEFPRDPKARRVWRNVINRQGTKGKFSLWEPKAHDRVCSRHFPNGVRRKDDIPERFLHPLHENTRARGGRKRSDAIEDFPVGNEVTIQANVKVPSEIKLNCTGKVRNNGLLTNVKSEWDHQYCLQDDAFTTVLHLKTTIEGMGEVITGLRKQLNKYREENTKMKNQICELKNERTSLEKKYRLEKISRWRASNMDTKKLAFYTGFKNHQFYNNFREFIKPGYTTAKKTLPKDSTEQACQMWTFEDEMMIVLMKLRLGLLHKDLAYRFNTSDTTISDIWNFWISLLSSQLSQVPIWPSRAIIAKHVDHKFKSEYPKTRVILDCTEIFVEKPSNCDVQSETRSNYKHIDTAKGLLGIAPNGFVSFLSPLCPGRTSDTEIVEKSGLIDKLEEGDDVMANRGFLIGSYLNTKNVTLNGAKNASTAEEATTTTKIASAHVHVERVIRTIKIFRILKYVFPNSMQQQLNNIWITCCYLINFVDVPLLERQGDESIDELDGM